MLKVPRYKLYLTFTLGIHAKIKIQVRALSAPKTSLLNVIFCLVVAATGSWNTTGEAELIFPSQLSLDAARVILVMGMDVQPAI